MLLLLWHCVSCSSVHIQRVHRVHGNDHFLTYILWWWKNQARLVRVGGGCSPTSFHYIYHHVQSWGVRSSWEGRYTCPIYTLPLYVLCGPSNPSLYTGKYHPRWTCQKRLSEGVFRILGGYLLVVSGLKLPLWGFWRAFKIFGYRSWRHPDIIVVFYLSN